MNQQEDVIIYRLPCTLTGLDAELDNCEEDSYKLDHASISDPLPEGMTRYITEDGVVLDCSIDENQWAEWFEVSELDEC